MGTRLTRCPYWCTAQEQFQVRFWKLRQVEYSPYLLQCSPLRVSHTPAATALQSRGAHVVRSAQLVVFLPGS